MSEIVSWISEVGKYAVTFALAGILVRWLFGAFKGKTSFI